jgi:hypothetical protein
MAFHVAMVRLKRALIPMLIGQQTGPMQGLFETNFQVTGAEFSFPQNVGNDPAILLRRRAIRATLRSPRGFDLFRGGQT